MKRIALAVFPLLFSTMLCAATPAPKPQPLDPKIVSRVAEDVGSCAALDDAQIRFYGVTADALIVVETALNDQEAKRLSEGFLKAIETRTLRRDVMIKVTGDVIKADGNDVAAYNVVRNKAYSAMKLKLDTDFAATHDPVGIVHYWKAAANAIKSCDSRFDPVTSNVVPPTDDDEDHSGDRRL